MRRPTNGVLVLFSRERRGMAHEREATMRIFGPTIAGAIMQLIIVGLITFGFYFLARVGYFSSKWPLMLCEEGTSCHSAVPLVRLSYLLTDVGVALTNNRLIAQTTK